MRDDWLRFAYPGATNGSRCCFLIAETGFEIDQFQPPPGSPTTAGMTRLRCPQSASARRACSQPGGNSVGLKTASSSSRARLVHVGAHSSQAAA